MEKKEGDDFTPDEGWQLQENWAGLFTDRTGHMATHVSGTHGKGNPFGTRASTQTSHITASVFGPCRSLVAGHTCVCVVENRTKIIECAPHYHVRSD